MEQEHDEDAAAQQAQQEEERRREEEESARRMVMSLGASIEPCRTHPEHYIFTDFRGRQAVHNCPGCVADAEARYGDPKSHRPEWEKGSDYYMSGRTLRHIGTTGNREVHTFAPGEKIK
jgi:hypothetical protein